MQIQLYIPGKNVSLIKNHKNLNLRSPTLKLRQTKGGEKYERII